MRFPQRADTLPVSLLGILSLVTLSSAVTIDCENIIVNKQRYDLSPLKGTHAVHWIQQEEPAISNFTFIIDLCASFEKKKGAKEDEKCPMGTHVCGIEYVYEGGTSLIRKVVAIAGNYIMQTHRTLDPKWSRLEDSNDAAVPGLKVELNGGTYPFKAKKSRAQKAYIDFVCNRNRTGLEGDEDGGFEDDPDGEKNQRVRRLIEENQNQGEGNGGNSSRSLEFLSYQPGGKNGELDELKLRWTTKYACEGESNNIPGREHWGFFTWLIIILFLATAAYLIFGSWLNYNRYGARGWDLLPHGDTIRDIPYYLKDFARRFAGIFQSPARRGGYSAV